MDRSDEQKRRRTDEVEISTRELRIEQKRFYFNLKENSRGRFLKIAEVSGGRSTIIIPVSGWVEFRDMLNAFIEPRPAAAAEDEPDDDDYDDEDEDDDDDDDDYDDEDDDEDEDDDDGRDD